MKILFRFPLKKTVLASFMMIITAVYLSYISHGEEIKPKKDFRSFPKQIAQWKGTESQFDQKVYDILGVEDSFLISYRDPDNRVVQVYVGFYHSQRKGDLIHSPKHCMPGAGWRITQTGTEVLVIPGKRNDKKLEVARLNLKKGLEKTIALYWFQSRGRVISSEYLQKIYLVWDAISKNRTDGSFVRLITPVDERGERYAVEYLKSFAIQFLPVLQEYIPGKILADR